MEKLKRMKNFIYIKYIIFLVILAVGFASCAIFRVGYGHFSENTLRLNITLVKVRGGDFQMGPRDNKSLCEKDELPIHKVYLDDYYIGKYEITFRQYDIFCKDTQRKKPSDNGWGRGNMPVIGVSWFDAKEFCLWLSKKTGLVYRLPTEAEWEYAARGGVHSRNYLYSGSNQASKVAWFSEDSSTSHRHKKNIVSRRTHIVDKKKANSLNIYDMSGNVWEWCLDGYNASMYRTSPKKNPVGHGSATVARGGCWYSNSKYCIVTSRDYDMRGIKDTDLGFRIVRQIKK